MSITDKRLGMMGHGIAANLVKHRYPLVFLDHPGNQPVDDLLAAGARSMATIADLAAEADVVLLCVTGTPEVEAILQGSGGLLASMGPGTIVIDHSTAIPSSTERLAGEVAAAGGRFLDAPMTRTPKDAEAGRLNLLVGGDDALFEECRPLLACYAENIVHAGPVGAGHRLKLLHNFVSIGFSTVLAEAAACAERAGVDVRVLTEVLATGGGKSVVLDRLRPYIDTRDTTQYGFSIGNAAKDLGYYAAMAEELGAARKAAEAIRDVLAEAVAEGHGRETVPEMVAFLAGEA